MADPQAMPVDLTTLGADVPLPPADSAFYAGLKRASDIPSLNLSREEMAMRICSLEFLVAKLYRKLGIDPNDE